MKPPPFRYARPTSRAEACTLLEEPGARVLAGGQSLVPMLTARTIRPTTLVDLAGIEDLQRLELDGEELVIGAMVRQHTVERSPLVESTCPLLARALAHVAHLQVRSQGTVVGSIAHAEPAAELPTVLVALDGRVVATRADSTRSIPAAEFFLGPRRTALAPDELVVEVRLPVGFDAVAFVEESRRHHDLPIVGVAVAARLDRSARVTELRIAVGSADGPRRLPGTEQALLGDCIDDAWCVRGQHAATTELQLDATSDTHPVTQLGEGGGAAASAHARHLAPVVVRRALERLGA